MSIDLKVISNRLRKSRETLAYSHREVSDVCGLSEDRIKELENGTSKPTGDEILILAAIYKCDFLQLIDTNLSGPSDLTDILFRRYGQTFDKVDRRSIQEFIHFCYKEQQLEEILSIKKEYPEFNWKGNFYKGHGANAAEKLRKHLKYEPNVVARDIYSDFRNIGIHIFRRKLNSNEISGVYINDPEAGHCVLINYNEDIYRQRFSVAHEVAHSIFDSDKKLLVTYENTSSKYSREDLVEIRANSFASNYLMPISMLTKINSWDEKNILHWSQQFRVSTAALLKALKDAKIITQEQVLKFKELRVKNTEKIDPETPDNLTSLQIKRRKYFLEKGLSDYYVQLCYKAYEKDFVSKQKLSELLNVDIDDLVEISKIFGRTIKYDL
ncbi:helix-turn-helix domain-containing protein [Pectobacterium sp. CHL-2024]|uniref:helix-turn-helix domain-containing protein n=1 Tax=Pectobacterium TaxID=122277 RepID=UPI000C1C7D82|nr:XRE family transcriptional regulator [Pectobacterium brasiliense]ATV42920.1 DNA-binding protein [Pectobacterium brasiliense]MCA6981183.1 XRE family transcriptional regulator [Pectobacterium brasiliense]MCH4990745.1 ImmA/IrrE family metallo-endopeptidase [Pectobacterium brasiliense]